MATTFFKWTFSKPFKTFWKSKNSNWPHRWNPLGSRDLEHYIATREILLTQNKPRESGNYNLSQNKRKALKEIKSLKKIMNIKLSDKGAACFIMNTPDYKNYAYCQLSKTMYYQKVPTDLTKKSSDEINDLVQQRFSNRARGCCDTKFPDPILIMIFFSQSDSRYIHTHVIKIYN